MIVSARLVCLALPLAAGALRVGPHDNDGNRRVLQTVLGDGAWQKALDAGEVAASFGSDYEEAGLVELYLWDDVSLGGRG
jgi:hypothetical protein